MSKEKPKMKKRERKEEYNKKQKARLVVVHPLAGGGTLANFFVPVYSCPRPT